MKLEVELTRTFGQSSAALGVDSRPDVISPDGRRPCTWYITLTTTRHDVDSLLHALARTVGTMKKLFTKPFKLGPTKEEIKPTPKPQSMLPTTTHTTAALQPKFTLPPTPHPCPHEYLAILATSGGLLLRPRLPRGIHPESHVKIAWGKAGEIEEIQNDGESDDLDWSQSVVVYGIIGILNLFTGDLPSPCIIITTLIKSAMLSFPSIGRLRPLRSGIRCVHIPLILMYCLTIGIVLDISQEVFSVKNVWTIPLTESRAKEALKTLATRNSGVNTRLSLVPTSVANPTSLDDVQNPSDVAESNAPRVTFADEDQVKIMTPKTTQGFEQSDDDSEPDTGGSSPADSVASTPSMEFAAMTNNVAKTLADRLSFWNKMVKKPSPAGTNSIDKTLADSAEHSPSSSTRASTDERPSLDVLMKEGDMKPAEVLEAIVDAQSSTPDTLEQKNSELEQKIIREVIHQFVKGGMYFAYRFGTCF